MNAPSFESLLRDATTKSSDLAFPVLQAATAMFALACAFFGRDRMLTGEAIAIGTAGLGLLIVAWAGFDRVQDLRLRRREWIYWKSGIAARMSVLALVNLAPVSVTAVVSHYWAGAPLGLAAGVLLIALWGTTAVIRLRAIAAGFASAGEEREGAIALAIAVVAALALVAWAVTGIGNATGYGITPSAIAADMVPVVSIALAALVAAVLAAFLSPSALLRGMPYGVVRLAILVLALPVLAVLLTPLQIQGETAPGVLPDYLRSVPARILLTAVLAVALAQVFSPRASKR